MTNSSETQAVQSLKVWDWTVRVFHWCLVVLIACMWSTAEGHGIWDTADQFLMAQGWAPYGWGNMGWHRNIGMLVLFLFFYRVYWGIFGSVTARFSDFVKSPGAILAYAKTLGQKPYKPGIGHNPIGALSVIALILVVGTQVGTGLFAVDVDGLESGPLSRFIAFDLGRQFSEFHEMSFRALYILISLHVIAVAFYQVYLRANLVLPMITGKRGLAETKVPETAKVVSAPLWNVALGIVVAAGLTWFIWTV